MGKQNAYTVYLVICTASAFLMTTAFATSAIYRFQMAHLIPLQLVLVGTALELSVFLFEIPTGIVADLRSRRLSVLIGFTMIGAGLFLEGSFTFFATILLAQVIWGIGYTFTSGAIDAWLADELGENRLSQTYLRATQLSQVASFAGIFVGTALASIRLNIPFLVGGVGLVLLAGFLYLFMPETNFTPIPRGERNTWQSMSFTFRSGMLTIRERPLLITILGIALIGGLASEGLDRLWEAHLLDNFEIPLLGNLEPIYWFGLINAAAMLMTLIVTEVIRRRNEDLSHRKAILILIVLNTILVAGLFIFGLANTWAVAVVAYILLSVARSTSSPVFSAWINRDIDSKVRATVLSTIGQMDAIGQVVGGPPMGALATRYGLRAAMVAVGILYAPALALYGRALGQDSSAQPGESTNR
jgi:DHA3 family tetracycline resistance protein-like MFS transporter